MIPHKDLVARTLAHRMDPDQVTLVDAHESSAHLLGHLVQFAVEGIFLVLGNAGDLPAIRDEVENLCLGDAVGDLPAAAEEKGGVCLGECGGGPVQNVRQLSRFGGL